MMQNVLQRTGEQLADVVEGSTAVAKDAARRVENGAGELVDGTSRTVKKHPVATAATFCAVAFASGMLLGRSRERHKVHVH